MLRKVLGIAVVIALVVGWKMYSKGESSGEAQEAIRAVYSAYRAAPEDN